MVSIRIVAALLGALLLLIGSSPAPMAAAAPGPATGEGWGEWHPLEAGAAAGIGSSAVTAQAGPPTSDIAITFVDVPVGMRPAIEHAATIWEAHVVSTAQIMVTVRWTSLSPQWIAQTRPAFRVRDPIDDPNLPLANIRYPSALANAFRGNRIDTVPDVEIELNSGVTTFYAGLNAPPPPDQYDLVSVVLHEIAHGLGIASGLTWTQSMSVGLPSIYDTLIGLADGTPLYTQPPTAVANALVGGELQLARPGILAAAGGIPVRLFAPSPWQMGSSVSHLHEFYVGPDDDGLMAPGLGKGWTYRDPGPVLLATLREMGWTISRLGQVTRLRVVTRLPSFVQPEAPLAIRVELQDPVGAVVTSGPSTLISLFAWGESTSGEGTFDCDQSELGAVGGKATFSGCAFSDTGRAYLVVSAPQLASSTTHSFVIAKFSSLRAPAVARSP